jgi:hypothetical protein
VLGRVVDPALGTSHKSAERRAIDDRTASLFAHLLQFELHAAPFAAEIDPHDAVVILSVSVCSLCEDILDSRVVISGIEPAESSHRLLDHGIDLRVIGDIATNGDGLVALGGQALGCDLHRGLVPVCQRDGRPRFRESLRCGEAKSRRCADHQRDLFLEGDVHGDVSCRFVGSECAPLALCALSLCLGVAVAFDSDLRGGGIDVPKIRRRKLDRTRADVLLEAAELGGAGDRDDPRLLRK